MKVLLLSPLPPPAGGIATWTKLFTNSEEAKKNNMVVIDTSITGSRVNNIKKRNIIGEILRTKKIYGELKKQLKKDKFEILHMNTSCSKFGIIRDYICARAAKKKKTCLIIHCHCDTKYMVKGKVGEFYFKKLCRAADKIFCLNEGSYNHIKGLTGKESDIVPNFFETNKLSSSDRNKTEEQIKTILYAGNILKSKGCDDILLVAKQMPHITFKMAGYLSEEMKEMTIPKNVLFLGQIEKEEVLKQMLAADLLLFPSHTEGFPNVVLEAMACGLPIVATPVGAIPDMLEDKGGALVNIGDVNSMIHAINHLQSVEMRRQMSEWNKEKVKKAYAVDIVVKKIFEEYSGVLDA